MNRIYRAWIAVLLCGVAAASAETALQGLARIPPAEANQVARIAGCEGQPFPDRWHYIVHAPGEASGTGLRDYTVANRQLVGRNGVSQFASEVGAGDVLPMNALQLDSDHAGLLAQKYARANRLSVATFNYELRRDALNLAPVWKVTCLDRQGRSLGWIVVNATDGQLVAMRGIPPENRPLDLSRGEPLLEEPAASTGSREGGFHPPAIGEKNQDAPQPPIDISDDEDAPHIDLRRSEPRRRERHIEVDPFRLLRELLPFR